MRRCFALALVLLISCKKPSDEIVVGAYLSLSGPDATFGSDTREGIELAVEEVNAKGGVRGRRVKMIYEDDKSTTQEASQKVRQLIDGSKAVAIIGEAASSRTLAGGLIANTSHVPMITPSATAVEVTKDREWVFRVCFTDDQQGKVAARWVVQGLKKKRVAVLYVAQDTYSSGLARTFREELLRLGGELAIEKGYQKGETSFRTQLSEVRSAMPEIVFAPVYYGDMVLIARQAKEVGLPGSMFVGGDGWDSTNLLEGASSELEGATFTNHYAPDVPWPSARRFGEAFRVKYKHDPAGGSVLGYDAATLLFDAMTRAPSIAPAPIKDALAQTKGFQGASGAMTMDAGHNVEKPIVIVKISGGTFHYASEL